MAVADEIRKLAELRDSGALSRQEFERAKARLLAGTSTGSGGEGVMGEAAASSRGAGATVGAGAGAGAGAGTHFVDLGDAAGEPAGPTINRLRRSETDRWIGGVCGGLARFSGVETWVWRLGFALGSLVWAAGFIAYILLWIFVPPESTG
jgi:phage shock protein PspC (stress-responsive transcriptional regulator)